MCKMNAQIIGPDNFSKEDAVNEANIIQLVSCQSPALLQFKHVVIADDTAYIATE